VFWCRIQRLRRGGEDEVVFSEHQPEPAAEDVHPFVALVDLRIRLGAFGPGRDDVLERLKAARAAAEREDGHAVRGEGPDVNAWG
jgi:hypothetical protein